MISAAGIARGKVWHQRLAPFKHRFSYPLWLVWCDLDAPQQLYQGHWAWGRRWRPVTYRHSDFVDGHDQAVADKVRNKAVEAGLDWSRGKLFMLAQWRTFGSLFNPLVLYLHFAEGASQPDSMLAEVQNTPWKEKHFYPLQLRAEEDGALVADHDKAFHVSPFLPMALRYHWRLHVAFPDLHLTLEDRQGDEVVFRAGVAFTITPSDQAALATVPLRFGAQGLITLSRIYWQALRLWRKGARFHRHPQRNNRP